MGAKAVSYFPQLAWRYEVTEGAVVTHVANDSSLRFAGIQEGDLVLSGMDRVVHDARSWKRVLDEESAALVAKVKKVFADQKLDTQDGVRIDWPDGWVHVRQSNTEPIARVIAEARDESRARELVEKVQRLRENS